MCDAIKCNGVSDDDIRLWLFSFSLKDKAKHWLNSKPPNYIITWVDLVQKLFAKFFPLPKTIMMRIEINNFAQYDGETFYNGTAIRNFKGSVLTIVCQNGCKFTIFTLD